MAQESYKISKYLDWDLLKIATGADKIKCVFLSLFIVNYRHLSRPFKKGHLIIN